MAGGRGIGIRKSSIEWILPLRMMLLGLLIIAEFGMDAVGVWGQSGGVAKTGTAADVEAARQADAERAKQKVTLAVLPFLGKSEAEKTLAERMRFAVSQKMSRDARFDRRDNVEVEGVLSALQIPWDHLPGEEELQKIFDTVGTDVTVLGQVQGRKLTLWLYEGQKLKKETSAEIPGDKESPRQTVETMLADLAEMRFVVRDVEADHSDPPTEQRWANRPNMVPDPLFKPAQPVPGNVAPHWWVLLKEDEWHPGINGSVEEARGLLPDHTLVAPKATAGVKPETGSIPTPGNCLMMRVSQETAENSGLGCISEWITVEDGQKYRIAVKYHSTGPTARIFIKGFARAADRFGDTQNPEVARREYYRAQVLPRGANDGWDLAEMDFTPAALEKYKDKKIEWVRVEFFVYLKPGTFFFDNVVVKKISK